MSDRLTEDLASLRIDRSTPVRSPWPRVLGLAAALVLGVGGVSVGKPWVEARVFKTDVEVTEIVSVSPSQAAVDLTATGYLEPQVTARVGAKVVGRIAKVHVREGQTVKAGDVLFELDAVDAQAAAASARARVAATSARVATARAQLAEARLAFDRDKRLVESGSLPRAQLDDLGARITSLESMVSVAEAEVAAAQAELAVVATSLSSLRIAAPIDGTAATKPASVGDIAGPIVGSASLVDLIDFSTLLAEVDVPEGHLSQVVPGGPCELALDALGPARFAGQVVEIGPRLNRAKATALVKVRFLEPPPELRPEMSVRASFLKKPLDKAALAEAAKIVVPAAAIVEREGGKAIWVVDGGKVRITPVTLGPTFGGGFVLVSGPPPGTRVVKDPPRQLADGQSIKEKSPS
jgi:RND family efflux transporter MFP subunit